MRMLARALAVLSLLTIALPATAQTKPDFSGQWTLQIDKSDFGAMPAPMKMTRTIVHTGDTLKSTVVQTTELGETTTNITVTTDGKPQQNTLNGAPMTTVGKWDGTTIVLSSQLTVQGAAITTEDRYTLSDGGKTLTVARKINTPDGLVEQKIVFAKK